MDPVERYLEVFEGLKRRKRWSSGIEILRFATLTLAASDVADPDSELEETAKVLSKEAGAFSPLSSSMRHAVAAILIRRGLDPVAIVHHTKETLAGFKEFKLEMKPASMFGGLVVICANSDLRSAKPTKSAIAHFTRAPLQFKLDVGPAIIRDS